MEVHQMNAKANSSTQIEVQSPTTGPEEGLNGELGLDEAVLARFGKRQQLRVSRNPHWRNNVFEILLHVFSTERF